jgi:hypothetical protein
MMPIGLLSFVYSEAVRRSALCVQTPAGLAAFLAKDNP